MTDTLSHTPPKPATAPSRWRVLALFMESPVAVAGLALFLIMAIASLLAPLIAPQNPFDIATLDIFDSLLPPGSRGEANGMLYLLGTDSQGRDLFSAILYGVRTSLVVSLVSVSLALSIGALAGLLAAFVGGWIDALIMRIVDIQLSFPAILVALILLSVLGQGIDKVIIALVVVQWAYFARTARSVAIAERNREYILATRSLCLSTPRILLVHLLPNCLPPLIVIATIDLALAVALESTLSFLGVGVPVTEPSLGMLIANGFEFMLSGYYWTAFFPGVVLALVIIAINLTGDHLREILNPRNFN